MTGLSSKALIRRLTNLFKSILHNIGVVLVGLSVAYEAMPNASVLHPGS